MRVILLFLHICFFAPGFCFADLGQELSTTQIEAKLQRYTELGSFKAKFSQWKHLKEMGLDLKSEGTLSVRRPDRIVWKIEKPSPLVLTMEGKNVTVVQGEGDSKKEQHWALDEVTSDKDMKGMNDMMAWLRLDAKAIAAAYRLVEQGQGKFKCLPRIAGVKSPFRSMTMMLGKHGYLEKLILEEASGDSLELTFSVPQRI